MSRRRFDHFYIELCCALDQRIPRFPLWLEMCERGVHPEQLSQQALLAFFDEHLNAFLARRRTCFGSRSCRQLRRRLVRYDPQIATPHEIMERLAVA